MTDFLATEALVNGILYADAILKGELGRRFAQYLGLTPGDIGSDFNKAMEMVPEDLVAEAQHGINGVFWGAARFTKGEALPTFFKGEARSGDALS